MTRRMQKDRRHEVVRVLASTFLVNSAHLACRYETADGSVLAPGYYLALWPGKSSRSTYGSDLQYFGPFATRTEALFLQVGAVALGIVETPHSVPASATQDVGGEQVRSLRGECASVMPTPTFAS